MNRTYKEYVLADAIAPRTITSSTDATPIVVTYNSHGLVTGDRITIFGHATNTNANGTWVVTKVDANSFSLDDSTATGGGAGGNTGVFAKAAKIALCDDFSHAILSFDTDGGADAAMTVKLVGSIGKSTTSDDSPDFAASQAADNQYDYIEVIDLEDGAAIDGDTGFVVATADDHRLFEANINALRWLTIIPIAGTAGEITVKLRLYTKI